MNEPAEPVHAATEAHGLKYCLAFLSLSVASLVGMLVTWETLDWIALALGYLALTFGLLASAYAGVGPRLLRKQASGHRSIPGWLIFGPYFLLNAATFALYRLFSREPAYAQVAPDLYFGRRLSAREIRGDWTSLLDLAAEFAEIRPFRELPGYRSLPVLDGTAPTEDELRSAVTWIIKATEKGPLYVHCALGHGRSACVVVAYLLSTGKVDSVGEGVQLLRSSRSGVRLNPAQFQRLHDWIRHRDCPDPPR